MKSKIDYKEITKLIDLLEARNLSHFELEVEGLKISIGRQSQTAPFPEIPAPSAAMLNHNSPPTVTETDSESASPGILDDLHYITSPMVGTFYRAPDPSSPSFIEENETVSKGQTLCIIEAMKLMNEIEADIEGVIAEIFVKNGSPVEYGQKLFSVRPQK